MEHCEASADLSCLARTYSHVRIRIPRLSESSNPTPKRFVFPGRREQLRWNDEGRFRGRSLVVPGRQMICIPGLCPAFFIGEPGVGVIKTK